VERTGQDGCGTDGEYALRHTYLRDRFADRVVQAFWEMAVLPRGQPLLCTPN
jgi:hypothetical protein